MHYFDQGKTRKSCLVFIVKPLTPINSNYNCLTTHNAIKLTNKYKCTYLSNTLLLKVISVHV